MMKTNQNKASPYFLLICSWGFLFLEAALRLSDSVIMPELSASFHMEAKGIALISSSYYFIYVALQIPAGILLDRFGIKRVLPAAILLVAIGSFFMGITSHLSVVIFSRVLMGVGSAFAFLTCVKLLREDIKPKALSLWIAITIAVYVFGAVTGQEPWLLMTQLLGNWRDGYLISSVLAISLAISAWCLSPYTQINSETFCHHLKNGIRTIFSDKCIILLLIYIVLYSAPVSVFFNLWGMQYLTQGLHISRTLSAEFISLSWLSALIGGPLLAIIADYFSIRKALLITVSIIHGFAMSSIIFYPPHNNMLLLTLLFSLNFITIQSIFFAMASEQAKQKSTGFVLGIINTFNMLGNPILQLVVGVLLATQAHDIIAGQTVYDIKSYQYALTILPIFLFLSAIMISFYKAACAKS